MDNTETTVAGQPLDDTREVRKVNVDDVLIDPNVQRSTSEARLTAMGPWDWDRAEMPTVARRADGTYVAIEGQNRILKLRKEHPGSKIQVVVRPSPVTGYASEEASVARGIARGRLRHSSFAVMDLELKAGDPYWLAAVDTLAEHSVVFAEPGRQSANKRAIVAVTTVGQMMHYFDDRSETPIQDAAALLSATIAVLMTAFEDQAKMWDRVLLQAVAGLLLRGADSKRLTVVLSHVSPADWLAEVNRRRHRTSPVRYLAEEILKDYNHGSRKAKVEW